MSDPVGEAAGRPVVAVGGIVFDDGGRVLVIRRGRPPEEGRYTIPGGKVEPGESLAEACRREVGEETGLAVEAGPLVEVVEKLGVGYHFVILDYLCRLAPSARGRAPSAAGDAADARFVDDVELAALPTTDALLPVVARARAMRDDGDGQST